MPDKPFETAFKLLSLGYSVIPSGGGNTGKAPLVDWARYQDIPPDEKQLEQWQSELKPRLWGIVTNDKVAVIEADTPETRANLESEMGQPNIISPRGGAHYYINTDGQPFKTIAGVLPGIDIRGVGGFVNIVGQNPITRGRYQIKRLPIPDELIPWQNVPKRILAALNGRKAATKVTEGELIPIGQNDQWLISRAGGYRHQGDSETQIFEKLKVDVQRLEQDPAHPYTEKDLLRIAKSASRYAPAAGNGRGPHFNLTDYGNAERMARQYGDRVRYSPERNLWLTWTGKVWQWDIGSVEIEKLAKKTARDIYHEAADEDEDETRKELVKHATQTERQFRIDAMIESLKSEPGIAIRLAELDNNHFLVNVNNGTIDLRTGELKAHERTDMITELLPVDYNPAAASDEWSAFLARVFNANADLIAYIQRAMGYSITGDQSEQVFFFCYGRGFNGKSTLLNTIRLVMGDYASQVPSSAFMVDKTKRGGGPNEAISSLKNKRLICSTELEDGQRLSTSLVKQMTGGEPLWCEHKFERGYNFQPTHKLWLSGNHEPTITDTTNSIWLRLKKIPFAIEIPEAERKKGYAEKLARDHTPAILAWIVKGCVEWWKAGDLAEPEAVKQAVADYRAQQDILHDFLLESCLLKKSASMDQSELYATYKQWGDDNDTYVISKTNFNNRIREKGIIAGRGAGNKATWIGIRLLTDDEKVNQVNAVNDFHNNTLREGFIGETLGEIVKNVNLINPYPEKPCLQCGADEPVVDEKTGAYKCGKCERYYPQQKGVENE